MGYSKATALNDPQTELVILGLSENAAVTTCGWARHFFDSGGSGFWKSPSIRSKPPFL
jgi:hypothetical protein